MPGEEPLTGTGINEDYKGMNTPTLKKPIEELLYQSALTPDESGRLWLLCYAEQETAKQEGRKAAYTEESCLRAIGKGMTMDDPKSIVETQILIADYSELIYEIKKAVNMASNHSHTAQTVYYAYLFEITDALRLETAYTTALLTPVILTQEGYKALTEKAGSTERKALANAYADTAEDTEQREYFKKKATLSGFSVMQGELPINDEEMTGILEDIVNPFQGRQIRPDHIRSYFENYYYCLTYVYYLERVLKVFSRAYNVPGLEKLARADRARNFFRQDTIDQMLNTLERNARINGTAKKGELYPRFNKELPEVRKKDLRRTRDRFGSSDPSKDKKFKAFINEIAEERYNEGLEQLKLE